jgi:hypothetical protein
MLKSIDVLIGLSVIMLALSMAVTVITQFATAALNTRGRHLKRGLADLLALLDPELKGATGKTIAHTVLTHPLVSGTTSRLGSVVHREEFTKLLLELADGNGSHPLDANARGVLTKALSANGVADPAAVLRNVRALGLQLEASNPDLATNTRNSIALLQEAKSDLVAKINNWFDQTMDRTSQRFTASTRAITFLAGILVVAVLQVDTVTLVNRLAADEKLREQFLASVPAIQQQAESPVDATTGEVSRPLRSSAAWESFTNANGLIVVPGSLDEWTARWSAVHSGGLAITVLLLSLGAPFWYSALSRVIQLRSVLAAKDDLQRNARQQVGGDVTARSL